MKKLLLILFFYNSVFAGMLKLFNIPYQSTVIINSKKYKIQDSDKLILTLPEGEYDVIVKNRYFHTLNLSGIKINNYKPTIIIINSNEKNTLIPVRKYYKTVFVKYYTVKNNGDGVLIKTPCTGKLCSAYVDSGLFSSEKKIDPVKKNLYVFKDNTEYDSFTVKTDSGNYFSTSSSSNIRKNEKITLTPVPSWSKFSIGFGLSISTSDVTLTNKAGQSVNIKAGKFYGYSIVSDYKINTPVDMYVVFKARGYLLSYSKDNNSNSDDNTGLNGFQYGAGLGHLFLPAGVFIEGGVLKNALQYEIADFDYDDYNFKYKDDDIVPYVEIGIGRLHLTYSKAVFSISYSTSF